MAQITDAQRLERIRQLHEEVSRMPPDKPAETVLVQLGGGDRFCKVITIEAEAVLLNPSSHRLQAQLRDDPEWERLGKEPFGEAAQHHLAYHIRESRTPESFAELKDSLETEGQQQPGVMTHRGVLINANTRVVALRELDDPDKRWVRVAVLPEGTQPEQLALLELHLQMQRELREDYSFTNELLFIEEMHQRHHMRYAEIARHLRFAGGNSKKGEQEVLFRLRALDMIRDLQRIPKEGLKLTFFDKVKLEQFRDLVTQYDALVDKSGAEARKLLESWLLAVALDFKSVHQLRLVDGDFVAAFVMPNLRDDEQVGAFIDTIARPPPDTSAAPLSNGVKALTGDDEAHPPVPGEHTADVKTLLDIVTQKDNTVKVPGTTASFERDDVKQAVQAAMHAGAKEKRSEDRESDKIEAPVKHLKEAIREIEKSITALNTVAADPALDQSKKKSLGFSFKKLRTTSHDLEELFKSHSIPTQ